VRARWLAVLGALLATAVCGIPVRFGVPPEISLLTLARAEC
jgi:hypothetical protein